MSEPDKTIAEFCAAKRISKTSYHALQKRGLGPAETVYPGTRIKRISATAENAWDKMAQLGESEAARLEAERRREIAAVAGRIAARSPLHISRRRQNDARRRGRTRG
jgi:hypothetical protein